MQQNTCRPVPAAVLAAAAGLAAGCPGPAPGPAPAAAKPYAGVALTVACPDPGFAKEVRGRAAGWAARTGAAVKVEARPPDPGADAAVVRPAAVGALAAAGELAPLPPQFRAGGHPLQFGRIAAAYSQTLAAWGGRVVGIPLAGDGYVLGVRADRLADPGRRAEFARRFDRALDAPATWEDVLDVAGFFAEADGNPALPPVPADPDRLVTEFFQVAACYDRPARAGDRDGAPAGRALGFQFGPGPDVWKPRVAGPGFAAAADWLHKAHKFRPAGGPADPVEALDKGSAVVAVLSLAEVGRLPRDPSGAVGKRFRVAPLPGARTVFDDKGDRRPAGRGGNFVPYLGAGGHVGVVLARSPAADAGWDLVADLGAPAAGLGLVSDPNAGAGPVRQEHTDPGVWLGYGFDEDRTRDLAEAVRRYLGAGVTNPATALRGPDAAALTAALEAEVRKAAAGQLPGPEAARRANDAWDRLDAGKPPEELTRWRRNAAGLQ